MFAERQLPRPRAGLSQAQMFRTLRQDIETDYVIASLESVQRRSRVGSLDISQLQVSRGRTKEKPYPDTGRRRSKRSVSQPMAGRKNIRKASGFYENTDSSPWKSMQHLSQSANFDDGYSKNIIEFAEDRRRSMRQSLALMDQSRARMGEITRKPEPSLHVIQEDSDLQNSSTLSRATRRNQQRTLSFDVTTSDIEGRGTLQRRANKKVQNIRFGIGVE